LVVLARPSPTYDPKALQFISETVRHLPPGVKVGDNDTGSWFADLIQTGADYIAPLLKAVPHPYAQGISAALEGGAAMTKAFRSKPAAERAAINNVAKAEIRNIGASGGKKAAKILRIVESQSGVNNRSRSKGRSKSRGPAPRARGRSRVRQPAKRRGDGARTSQSPWTMANLPRL